MNRESTLPYKAILDFYRRCMHQGRFRHRFVLVEHEQVSPASSSPIFDETLHDSMYDVVTILTEDELGTTVDTHFCAADDVCTLDCCAPNFL